MPTEDNNPGEEPGFALPKTEWQYRWSASMQRDEERTRRIEESVRSIQAARQAHTQDAERAAIETSRLVNALVELSTAQQQQLSTQAGLLNAMVEQTAELTAHARTQSHVDDARWTKSWRAQRGELVAGILGALLAGAAIWAAFAAAKPPVVNVPTPVVSFETTTTRPETTTAPPSTATPPPAESPDGQPPSTVGPGTPP